MKKYSVDVISQPESNDLMIENEDMQRSWEVYKRIVETLKESNNLYREVIKNKYGYYELKEQYRKSMKDFYENEYYQEDNASYQKTAYAPEDILDKEYFYAEKELVLRKYCVSDDKYETMKDFLDIGCGEGFALSYFNRRGWKVQGIDFSEYGLMAHNPDMKKYLVQGDCMEVLSDFQRGG